MHYAVNTFDAARYTAFAQMPCACIAVGFVRPRASSLHRVPGWFLQVVRTHPDEVASAIDPASPLALRVGANAMRLTQEENERLVLEGGLSVAQHTLVATLFNSKMAPGEKHGAQGGVVQSHKTLQKGCAVFRVSAFVAAAVTTSLCACCSNQQASDVLYSRC